MKYFAKYLSTEEKIQPGDKVIDAKIAPKQGLTYIKGDVFINDFEDEVILPQWETRFNFKKVKLFLCTHDIKEGEEFVSGLSKEVWIKGKGMSMHPNDYKVIGEISPQATWVKNDDEFDKSETMIRMSYFNDREGWSEYVLIKGCCGHFH